MSLYQTIIVMEEYFLIDGIVQLNIFFLYIYTNITMYDQVVSARVRKLLF